GEADQGRDRLDHAEHETRAQGLRQGWAMLGAAPDGGGEGVGGHAERQHGNGERGHHDGDGNSAGRMTARSTRGPAPRVQHAGLARRKQNPLIAPCPKASMLTRSRLGYVGSYSPTAAPLAPRSPSINPHMAPAWPKATRRPICDRRRRLNSSPQDIRP